MSTLSPDFVEALAPILAALGHATGRAPLKIVLDRSAVTPRIDADSARVPVASEIHWRRFRTVPTDLVRDLAYAARRAQRPQEDEADRVAFVEVFVRDHVLGAD